MDGVGEKGAAMPRYEFVSRAEYTPVRKEIEKIIKRAQDRMLETDGKTFQFQLVGSGKKHLIAREIGGNRGYDFDYNLIIQSPEEGYHYKAKLVKQRFMRAFSAAVKGTTYSSPKDSTSVITIKVVDRKNSRILHSCDFAIIYYGKHQGRDGYYYLRKDKNHGGSIFPVSYDFKFRLLTFEPKEKVTEICQQRNIDGWKMIQDEYLKVKERDLEQKPSYSLYLEAVNNVYNQIFGRCWGGLIVNPLGIRQW